MGLLEKAVQTNVSVVQIADNLPLHGLSERARSREVEENVKLFSLATPDDFWKELRHLNLLPSEAPVPWLNESTDSGHREAVP
jgi:hypothetical protein